MPEVIKQELGFDASQALTTLANLESSLQAVRTRVSSLTKSLGSFNAKADKTDGVLKRLKTSAGNAATQMNRLGNAKPLPENTAANAAAATENLNRVSSAAGTAASATESASKKAEKSISTWTVSWKTMARVVATQAIVRALNAIRQALKATVGDAIEFQRSIAEVGTIGADKFGGLTEIGDLVTDVADKFNVGLADTAEAAYQTVSNQIANSAAELESFLGSAAKFAKVTKTDMTTAVNLLSGTLNAFGKDVSETEDVAAKFFKTIELGRTRSEELALGLGTIAPIADQLGISMEELNASIATLTIGGIKTDKAVTQIRGAMQGFLKATPEMIAVMKELGFETGEQILQAYDFQDAIRAVISKTDGSAASIAKLFPRIRGLTGVMGLAKDESDHFKRAMEEQQTALEGTYDRAYKLVVSTDAEKVTKFFNEVKNFFTTEIGQRFLSGLVFVLQLEAESPRTALDAIMDVNAEVLKEENKLADKRLQINLDLIEKKKQAMAQDAAIARQSFFAAAEAAEEANRIIVSSTEWALDSMMGPIDAAVDGIRKAASEGKELMKAFADEASESLADVQKTAFSRSVSTVDDPNVKVSLLRKKSAEESLRAQELAAQATTKADLAAAKQLQASSRAYNDQAFAIARSITKKYENGEATRDLTKRELELQKRQASGVTQDLILRQDRYQKALKKGKQGVEENAKSLAESSREIVTYQAKLEGLRKKLTDLQKVAADTSLTPSDQEAQREAALAAAEELSDAYKSGVARFAESVDPLVRGLFEEIQRTDVDVELQTIMQVPTNMKLIHDQIQAAFKQMFDADPLNVQVKFFAEQEGESVETSQQLSQAQEKYSERLSQSQKDINSAEKAQNEYNRSQKNSLEILKSINAISEKRVEFTVDPFGGKQVKESIEPLTEGEQKFNAILTQINELAVRGPEAWAEVNKLAQALDALPNELKLQLPGQEIFNALGHLKFAALEFEGQAENTESAMSEMYNPLLNQSLSAQKSIEATTDAHIRMNDTIRDGAQLVQQAEQAGSGEQAAQQANLLHGTQTNITTEVANTNLGIDSMVTKFQAVETVANNVATAVDRIAQSASAVQGPSILPSGVSGGAHSQGGSIGYFAHGGQGTDNIPAMLSAGEHITNARSSRRFFSQLQAINAGQTPVFRSEGGDTYNTTVGDINVSGAGSPQVVARDVMRAIRREERRGSGR